MSVFFKRIIYFIRVGIWQIPEENLSAPKILFLDLAKKLILAIRFFTARKVINVASALTYSTLLAIVPIMAVVFAIPVIMKYNGKRGQNPKMNGIMKYVFYIYYPLHLFIIGWIQWIR